MGNVKKILVVDDEDGKSATLKGIDVASGCYIVDSNTFDSRIVLDAVPKRLWL